MKPSEKPNPQLIPDKSYQRGIVNVFIVLSLLIMLTGNYPLLLPHGTIPSVPADDTLASVQDVLSHIGYRAGIRQTWTMFAPVDRQNWYMVYSGIKHNGDTEKIYLPHQTKRNFLEENFIDFREHKYFLNIYHSPEAYAPYLCSLGGYKQIGITKNWHKINSVSDYKLFGQNNNQIQTINHGEYLC